MSVPPRGGVRRTGAFVSGCVVPVFVFYNSTQDPADCSHARDVWERARVGHVAPGPTYWLSMATMAVDGRQVTVLQPRLHPDSPPRPHPRTRRACAPLPVAFAPRGADPRACLPAATPPHPSRHPVCRRSRGGVRPRQGSREARRGAQWRRRGPRGLGERSGARGEAQGPCRRDFSRHSGARGTHPDRVPHTDNLLFSRSVWCFFVCSIV